MSGDTATFSVKNLSQVSGPENASCDLLVSGEQAWVRLAPSGSMSSPPNDLVVIENLKRVVDPIQMSAI
ncbi:hypothetical protein ACVI1L_004444 [Bradyrhizobium sp. USDA 4516]